MSKFVDDEIVDQLFHLMAKTPFENAICDTFYRIQFWARALTPLDHPQHFQIVQNAARGIYELTIDLKLLQADPSQAEKYHDHSFILRFKAAKNYGDSSHSAQRHEPLEPQLQAGC